MLAAILVSVQALTWALVFEVTRREAVAQGERQLAAEGEAFVHQLDAVSQRVADSVEVLSKDFPLRAAIAQDDRATVQSALRNHGRRVGAERMLLLDLDGAVTVDTGEAIAPGSAFPFPELLDDALSGPVAAVVAIDGRAYWL